MHDNCGRVQRGIFSTVRFIIPVVNPEYGKTMDMKCYPTAAVPLLLVFVLMASGCTGGSASRDGQLPAAGGSGFAGCREGYTNCSFSCVDLQRDVFNCGSCGSTCLHDETCSDGECVPA